MGKERLHYIDVAKGILMLMVVYGHVDGTATFLGYDCRAIDDVHRSVNVFVSFYMPCFFVITGFCGSFNKSFKEFLLSSLKIIFLPAIFFSFLLSGAWIFSQPDAFFVFLKKVALYGGDYWFLSALFIVRLLYWVINRWFSSPSIIIFCIISFLIGFFLSPIPHKYEYWWFVHALCLLPYLGVGQFLKHLSVKIDFVRYTHYYLFFYVLLFSATVYFSRVGVLQKDCFFDVPGLTLGFINLNITMFLPLILLSITGSMLLLGLSKKQYSCNFLEFLGRNSLVIYCVQGITLIKSMTYISRMGGAEFGVNYWTTLLLLLLSFFVSVLICAMIAWVMNMKYLRIAIGKF